MNESEYKNMKELLSMGDFIPRNEKNGFYIELIPALMLELSLDAWNIKQELTDLVKAVKELKDCVEDFQQVTVEPTG